MEQFSEPLTEQLKSDFNQVTPLLNDVSPVTISPQIGSKVSSKAAQTFTKTAPGS
jgi:hypothetical protein